MWFGLMVTVTTGVSIGVRIGAGVSIDGDLTPSMMRQRASQVDVFTNKVGL
jgi:hypothetical protein